MIRGRRLECRCFGKGAAGKSLHQAAGPSRSPSATIPRPLKGKLITGSAAHRRAPSRDQSGISVCCCTLGLTKGPAPAARRAPSQCLQRLRDLVDMSGHLDLVPDVAHNAVLVDQEGRAVDAHVLAAVQALLDPGAVLLTDLAILVGHQRKVEFVLDLELVVARAAVLSTSPQLPLALLACPHLTT